MMCVSEEYLNKVGLNILTAGSVNINETKLWKGI